MSSIQFDATLNTDKLESSIKQSNKTVKDWAKGVEKAGDQADVGLDKMSKSFKEAITEQKQLIKSIEQDVNNLQKAYDKAVAGKAKQTAALELRGAKKALAEEQATLIGLQKEQIDVNNKEKSSTDTLTGSISNWALSLGGAALAMRVVKEAVMATTYGLNTFNTIAAVSKQVMYNLVTGSIDLGNGIAGVIAAQKELNRLRIDDKLESYKAKIEMLKYNEALIEAKDQTNSVIDRIRAYDEAIAHKKKSTDIEIQSVRDQIKAYKDILEASPDNEKAKMTYIDLQTKLVDLKIRETSAMKEISSMRSGLIKKEAEDNKKREEALKAAADKQNEINNSITEQTKLLKEAVLAGTKEEIRAIAERIVLLKEELILREKLTREAIGAAIIRETGVSKLTGIESPVLGTELNLSGLAGAPDAFKKESKYIKGTTMLKRKALEQIQEDKEKYAEEDEENLKRQLAIRQEILTAAMDLTYQIAEQAGLNEDSMKFLSKGMSAIDNLARGNFIGAATNALSLIVSTLSMGTETFEDSLERMEERLKSITSVLENAPEQGDERAALENMLVALKSELEVAKNELSYAEYKLRHANILNRAARLEAVETAENNLKEVQSQLLEIEKEYDIFLRGGITGTTIADMIAQGFQEGKTSVADFANYMNDVLSDAVLNVFKAEILGDQVNDLKEQISRALEDKILTEEEKNDINAQVAIIADANRELWDNLTGSLDLGDNASNAGLTGQIRRSITEETGTELAGLFRRFADEQRVVRDYTIQGVSHLVGIEANTAETVTELQRAIIELQAINTNTKQVSVAGL